MKRAERSAIAIPEKLRKLVARVLWVRQQDRQVVGKLEIVEERLHGMQKWVLVFLKFEVDDEAIAIRIKRLCYELLIHLDVSM